MYRACTCTCGAAPRGYLRRWRHYSYPGSRLFAEPMHTAVSSSTSRAASPSRQSQPAASGTVAAENGYEAGCVGDGIR